MDIYIFGVIGISAGAIMGTLARGAPLRRALLNAVCAALGWLAMVFALQHGWLRTQDAVALLIVSATLGILFESIKRRRAAARLAKADGPSDK